MTDAAEQGFVDGGLGWGERVVDPFAFTSSHEQSGPPQVGEMTRNGRLRHLEDFLKLADAPLALRNQIQDAQPRLIRKGFEKLVRVAARPGRISRQSVRKSFEELIGFVHGST